MGKATERLEKQLRTEAIAIDKIIAILEPLDPWRRVTVLNACCCLVGRPDLVQVERLRKDHN